MAWGQRRNDNGAGAAAATTAAAAAIAGATTAATPTATTHHTPIVWVPLSLLCGTSLESIKMTALLQTGKLCKLQYF